MYGASTIAPFIYTTTAFHRDSYIATVRISGYFIFDGNCGIAIVALASDCLASPGLLRSAVIDDLR